MLGTCEPPRNLDRPALERVAAICRLLLAAAVTRSARVAITPAVCPPVRSLGSSSSSCGASRCASATSAAVSGVIGSRDGTTRPIVCTASGSTMGMARIVSVRPSVSASFAGMTLAQRPVRTCANSTIMELDSKRRLRRAAGPAQQFVDDAPVLHVGREQAERNLRHLRPGHRRAVAEAAHPTRSTADSARDRAATALTRPSGSLSR